MNRFLVLVALVLISFKSFACLNWEIKTLKNKVEVYRDNAHDFVPKGHQFKIKDFPSLILDLEKGYEKTNDIDYLSDKGYVLIIQGKYKEALELYLNIEKIKPGRYSTASNLGTLYELMGENEKAYEWIKKSIEINSESHEGSEWLHLKILEAKIKGLKKPTGEFFIGTNFGSEIVPKTTLSDEAIAKLRDDLYFQLNERISFIKPEDYIISVLLFELGNVTQLFSEYFYKEASELYSLSKKYGFHNELINERLIGCLKLTNDKSLKSYEEMQTVALKQRENDNKFNSRQKMQFQELRVKFIVMAIIAIVSLICAIFFFLKWKKLKKATSIS